MAPDDTRTIDGSRIVRQLPGKGTGDSYYKTADGQWWHTSENAEVQTGETRSPIKGE